MAFRESLACQRPTLYLSWSSRDQGDGTKDTGFQLEVLAEDYGRSSGNNASPLKKVISELFSFGPQLSVTETGVDGVLGAM